MKVQAKYWELLGDGRVRCRLCPHDCELREGQTGICRTRTNLGGTLYSSAYGNPCSVAVDPIEKKPLFHFFPGSRILSLAEAGCNLRCKNCQNSDISQTHPDAVRSYDLSPEDVVELAIREQTDSIAFTYTEPTVFYEYMLDIATLSKARGLKNVVISNGFINAEPLRELCTCLDAANIDLKVFDDGIYRKLTGARLNPVLETLLILKQQGVWLEITNLLVPGYSDEPRLVRDLCEWLAGHGFEDTPLHFSRFFPQYELSHVPPTPPEDLFQAYDTAVACGLKYVYVGNLVGRGSESTLCPACRKTLISRQGYAVGVQNVVDGACRFCGTKIAGVFE